MHHSTYRLLILATLTAALAQGVAANSVELIPNTLRFFGHTGRIQNFSEGGVRLYGPGARQAIVYLTPSGSPVSLEDGQRIKATYRFSIDDPKDSSAGVRVALLNSGGERVDTDTGLTHPAYTNLAGYGAFYNPVPAAGTDSLQLRFRPGGHDNLITSNNSWPLSGGMILERGASPTLQSGVVYTGVFTITAGRTKEEQTSVTITHEFPDFGAETMVTRSTTTHVVTAFDAFAIANAGSQSAGTLAAGFFLHSVKVEGPSLGLLPPIFYAGLESDEVGNVETGGFLNEVNVFNKPWVYSYELDRWVRMPTPAAGFTGAWVYFHSPAAGTSGASGPGTYAGEMIDAGGFVDTGDFMGVLHVAAAPWVYSNYLNGWIWMADPGADFTGAWTYVLSY